ncbi:MarR family transcriptional regulator [Nocardioides sp.]|uniref:MarR family winged helix-turn-helix transcriptional regulator n=1 Tax=Nocardioides sp. TaxID=35761 RepID=UPI00286A1F8A|nr:MarR family transcriptional regulator [Nocardioides sp.]
MVSVKSEIPAAERHVAVLVGGLMLEVREGFPPDEWEGLRQSHFRVIASVPVEGVSVTELADRVRMTKQGCGQFVDQLVSSGHLTREPSLEDGRVRLVRRTGLGEQNVRDVTRRMEEIEDRWRDLVGVRRYATFRRVLEEIATRSDDA